MYYAQYAHARICSILRQAPQLAPAQSYELLTHEKEIALMKYINEFSGVVSDAAKYRAPVSYTHLDVYKRQHCNKAPDFMQPLKIQNFHFRKFSSRCRFAAELLIWGVKCTFGKERKNF